MINPEPTFITHSDSDATLQTQFHNPDGEVTIKASYRVFPSKNVSLFALEFANGTRRYFHCSDGKEHLLITP